MAALQSRTWSLVALLARAAIGLVFISYGYEKYQNPENVQTFFTSLGVPRPELAATVVTWVELAGGALLAAGFLLPLAGTALTGVMAGAWWFTQRPEAVLVLPRETYELELALAAGALLIGFSGGGKVSFDHLLSVAIGRTRGAREDAYFHRSRAEPEPEYPHPDYPTGQYFPTAPAQPPTPPAGQVPQEQMGTSPTSVFDPYRYGEPPPRH